MAKQPQPSTADQKAAYARAEQAISETGKNSVATLDLSGRQGFKHLATLPPDIANLTALTRLDLRGTQVSDLSPLTDLIALTSLDLEHTQVSDVSPLAGLTALNSLGLNGTQVSDVSPLAGLTTLTSLVLVGTQVSDIAPLAGLTALTDLYLSGTQVSDLSPLLKLTQLEKNPSKFGLSFENTAAAKADKRIAEMAKTTDAKDRAAALFAYLRDGQAEQQAQYNALLSTRLMRASIGDFHFDDLTRVMRLMPFEEDLRRLRDPDKLKQFIEQAEDLRDGMRTLSNAVSQSGGNMQGAGIAPYLEGIISELDRAKTSDTLRVGKIIEYGEALEDFSIDTPTQSELGEPISKDLTRQVNALLELTRSHFADTFLRFAPLRDIEMDPDQTPTQALAQVKALLRSTRAAAQNNLIPLAPEDDEVFTHILRSIEKLIRAHGQATTEKDRASYQREINFKLALFTNSIGLYQIKAKNYGDKLGTGVDWLLKQLRRVKGLSELIELFTENLHKL